MTDDLSIQSGEHWFIVGQTGAGKTYFETNFVLPRIRRQIVVDTEERDFPDDIWVPVAVSKAISLAKGNGAFRVRVPMGVEDEGRDDLDLLSRGLLRSGHDTLLYVDELADFCRNGHVTGTTLGLIRKARKRGISVHAGTQRPQDVHKGFYTQAQHHVWFYIEPADVYYWHLKAPYLDENMASIPFKSFKWLHHAPSGSVTTYDPVPEFKGWKD